MKYKELAPQVKRRGIDYKKVWRDAGYAIDRKSVV